MTVARSVARAVASSVARPVAGGIGGGLHTYFTDNRFDNGAGSVGNDFFTTVTGYNVTRGQVGFFGESEAALVVTQNNATANKRFASSTVIGVHGWAGIRFYAKISGSIDSFVIQELGGGVMATWFRPGIGATPLAAPTNRPSTWSDIRALSDGWFECRCARDTSISQVNYRPSIIPWLDSWGTPSSLAHSNVGDGTSGMLVSRPQLTGIKASLAEVQAALS